MSPKLGNTISLFHFILIYLKLGLENLNKIPMNYSYFDAKVGIYLYAGVLDDKTYCPQVRENLLSGNLVSCMFG